MALCIGLCGGSRLLVRSLSLDPVDARTSRGHEWRAGWVFVRVFCLAKAVQMGVFAALSGMVMRKWFAVPAIAAIWVTLEWTHPYTGFEWLNLGNAASDMSLPMRLAPVTGVWGISFLAGADGRGDCNGHCRNDDEHKAAPGCLAFCVPGFDACCRICRPRTRRCRRGGSAAEYRRRIHLDAQIYWKTPSARCVLSR